jgi:hypothetical protein
VYEAGSENHGGKAEAEWTYRYRHDPENPLKEKPKYFFTATGQRCKEAKSGNVEMSQDINVEIVDEYGNAIDQLIEYELTGKSGESIKGETSEAAIEKNEVTPGLWEIVMTVKEEKA